ncbi:ribosome silencing factor [Limnohabitans sp. 2KL-51]|uniref:ribosome silencing factor n=1 Tax=Limnohabitans sp. 2KL-51 TaxID=1977911 RepID=UPI000D3C140E|nr:ribosome silencing factor [Limnohabitans sp. 2KL-51]PUE46878.1 ribosome silencing factor [Limnohabitans sp. 2KL-51]
MTDNAAKKDIQKLQRTIVDALEDVKAQEIQVFDTEHLSSLFERVIIASGTSNRQTKALAASVRDKVRNAGFGKPRIEGEDNGEWIIVDCGPAVVHVMQPTIRTYYNLEEIWGGTPVRLKFGAPKPAATAEVKGHIKNSVAKKATGKVAAKSAEAKTPAAKKVAAKPVVKAKPALKAPAKSIKPAAKPPAKTTTKSSAKTAAKSTPKASSPTSKPTLKTVGKPTAKPAAKKAPARKPVQAATRRKTD